MSSRPAAAQTTATLQAFNIERALALTDLRTTITPMGLDPGVVASIAGGALEIRERLVYNSQQGTLTSTVFVVPSGSPIPTPLAVDITRSLLEAFTIGVSDILLASKPVPSILFAGNVVFSTVTPYGTYQGAPATVSVGYTTDTPPKITNVVDVIAGIIVGYSGSGAGAVAVLQPSTPGGGGPNSNAPTVVLSPATQTAVQTQLRLDASKSTDPNGLALTYSWKVLQPPAANIINPTSATPDVQIVSGFGVYSFQVTVTNSAGLSTTAIATVQYIGR